MADLVRVRAGQVSAEAAAAVVKAGKRRTWHTSQLFGRSSVSGEADDVNDEGNKCSRSISSSNNSSSSSSSSGGDRSKRSSWHQRQADLSPAALAYHMVLSDNCVPLRGSASPTGGVEDRRHQDLQSAAAPLSARTNSVSSPLHQSGHFSIAAWVERPAFDGRMQMFADDLDSPPILRSVSIENGAPVVGAASPTASVVDKRDLASSISANYFDTVVRDLRGLFHFLNLQRATKSA